MNIVFLPPARSSQEYINEAYGLCDDTTAERTSARPACCEYHSRTFIGERNVRPIASDTPVELKPHKLDESLLKNSYGAIKSIANNDLSFLKTFLTNYPAQIDVLLPYEQEPTCDNSDTHFSLLQIAVLAGNPEAVKVILQFNPGMSKNLNPLPVACRRLHHNSHLRSPDSRECHSKRTLDILRQLLEHGASPNTYSCNYYRHKFFDIYTPLDYCIRSQSLEAVELLLSYGAKPMPNIGKEKESAKMLQRLCSHLVEGESSFVSKLLPKLIDNGLDINAYYGDRQLIHVVCSDINFCKHLGLLMQNGADINTKIKKVKRTALHQLLIVKDDRISLDLIEKLRSYRADFSIKGRVTEDELHFFPSRLRRTLNDKKTFSALDLLPNKFPKDISLYSIKNEEQSTVRSAENKTADKVPTADKKPSLLRRVLSTVRGAKQPGPGQPSRQQHPTSCRSKDAAHAGASYQKDSESSLSPSAAVSGVSGEFPPSYSSLFPSRDKGQSDPQKKSWSSQRNKKQAKDTHRFNGQC